MSVVIANPQVIINNIPIAIKPNSVSFTEGFGEQILRAASAGGKSVVQVLADNVEDNFSDFKVSLDNTIENIELARVWKSQPGINGIICTGTVTDGTSTANFRRVFNKASLVNNYEVPLGADVSLDLEFKSDPAQ